MNPKLELAAITDEFSPDLAIAVDAMAPIGMTACELRAPSTRRTAYARPSSVEMPLYTLLT